MGNMCVVKHPDDCAVENCKLSSLSRPSLFCFGFFQTCLLEYPYAESRADLAECKLLFLFRGLAVAHW